MARYTKLSEFHSLYENPSFAFPLGCAGNGAVCSGLTAGAMPHWDIYLGELLRARWKYPGILERWRLLSARMDQF